MMFKIRLLGHTSGNFQNLLPIIESHLRNRTILKWQAFYESKFKMLCHIFNLKKKKIQKMCSKLLNVKSLKQYF